MVLICFFLFVKYLQDNIFSTYFSIFFFINVNISCEKLGIKVITLDIIIKYIYPLPDEFILDSSNVPADVSFIILHLGSSTLSNQFSFIISSILNEKKKKKDKKKMKNEIKHRLLQALHTAINKKKIDQFYSFLTYSEVIAVMN